MRAKFILISWEDNAQPVNDALVTAEDRLNESIGRLESPFVEQLNFVLCSVSDNDDENRELASNMVGRRRIGGIKTFGCCVPISRTEFASTDAAEIAIKFQNCAAEALADAAGGLIENAALNTILTTLRQPV